MCVRLCMGVLRAFALVYGCAAPAPTEGPVTCLVSVWCLVWLYRPLHWQVSGSEADLREQRAGLAQKQTALATSVMEAQRGVWCCIFLSLPCRQMDSRCALCPRSLRRTCRSRVQHAMLIDDTVVVVSCVAAVSEEERRLEAVNRSKDDVDKRIVAAQRAVRGISPRSTLCMLCMHSQRVSMCTSSCVFLLCRGCASHMFSAACGLRPVPLWSVLSFAPFALVSPVFPCRADRGGRRSAVHNARSHPRH